MASGELSNKQFVPPRPASKAAARVVSFFSRSPHIILHTEDNEDFDYDLLACQSRSLDSRMLATTETLRS